MLPFVAFSQQVDSNSIKRLYDHSLDFTEEKIDSLKYNAEFIGVQSKKNHFVKGNLLSLRLKGLAQELQGNYQDAVEYYLQCLEAARNIGSVEHEISALSDLSITYSQLKRFDKAREIYFESAHLSAKRGDVMNLITAYTNLGAIYNQLNLPDSAMLFLKEGLTISKLYEDKMDLSSLYNNIGNVYFLNGNYDKALEFFNQNKNHHLSQPSLTNLWIDYLNIADVLIEKKKFDSAAWYAEQSLQAALRLHSKAKESDSYSLLSKLYSRKGNYRKAFNYQQRWYAIDTALVNREINHSITGLQEKFNAKEREQQNFRLSAEIEKEKIKSNAITYLAIAAAIIASITAIFLVLKRSANKKLVKVNELISRQNKKLAELNFEKNSLISMVSHDLGTPFASIRMWGDVLQSANENLNDEQRKAIEKIIASTQNGEKLISTILDIEKIETDQPSVQLEHFNVKMLVENIVSSFIPVAAKKSIQLTFNSSDAPCFLLSDKQFVIRICENLFTNAIKFTHPGKRIWVSVIEEKNLASIQVKDEGVGINTDELPLLYSKYGKMSSRPTNGEVSTGLGLFIVKRLIDELNGEISCTSKVGKGSIFTVVLPK
ncbi:MAG: tetratricopeptide repeat-containing sensor histidine kinase [Chitinophagaceae bacterium]